MTDVLTGTPEAAWYPDPAQPELLRWWDGSSWSVHTMARPDVAPAIEDPRPAPTPEAPALGSLPPVLHTVPAKQIPDPMPFASGVSLGADGSELYNNDPPVLTPIERAARAEIYAKLASSHAKEVAPAANRPGSDPFGDFSNASRMNWNAPAPTQQVYPEGVLSSTTLGVWLLVLWPTIWFFAGRFIAAPILAIPDPLVALIAVVAAFFFTPFLFTAMDRSALGRIGHRKRPRGWWLFTTWLGYLIARTVILSRRSVRAFVPLLVFVLIGVGSFTYNVLTSPEIAMLLNPPTVEEQLTATLEQQTNMSYGVECPEGVQPPYTCHAVAADGTSFDVDVTLQGGLMTFTQDPYSIVGPNGD